MGGMRDLIIDVFAELAGQEAALDMLDPTTGRYVLAKATAGLASHLPPYRSAVTMLTGRDAGGFTSPTVVPGRRAPKGGAVLVLPLGRGRGMPVGVVAVPFQEVPSGPLPLTLMRMAARIGPVLEDAEAGEEAIHRAVRDPLTGAHNRGFLDSFLEAAAARALRNREPLALGILDLDRFKQVNDTYGHQAGDRVLREFATAVIGCARASDVAARYGGEEFALVLPGTDAAGAGIVCEHLRGAIQGRIRPADGAPPVTFSAGVAAIPSDARDVGELIWAADKALYQAKERGRNRTVLAH
jgi:diguanylate cyclase (GGDEF)-like protein